MWDKLKGWFQLGKEIGFSLLREDCRHCDGKGICHTGRSVYIESCATCQRAAMGEVKTHHVKCAVCDGRGVFVFALPQGEQATKAILEVLPRLEGEWSTIKITTVEVRRDAGSPGAGSPALPPHAPDKR